MKDPFSRCHPAVNFLYFALVLVCSMFFRHPVSLAVSLVCACCYATLLGGKSAVRFQLRWMLPLMLLAAVTNPAFNHYGVTILCYLPTGNPLTLESILYGLAAAAMLAAVLMWFYCFNEVITSDKFVYLFGRVIPALSLMLSMALRFVPRFHRQLSAVADAQRCLGRDVSNGRLDKRLRTAMKIFSITVTWALENAIMTADSMRSRGYGEPGRTSFSIYRFDARDRALLAWLSFCGVFILTGALSGGFYYSYSPMLRGAPWTPLTAAFQAVYLLQCLTPIALELHSRLTWRKIQARA